MQCLHSLPSALDCFLFISLMRIIIGEYLCYMEQGPAIFFPPDYGDLWSWGFHVPAWNMRRGFILFDCSNTELMKMAFCDGASVRKGNSSGSQFKKW